MVKDRERQTIEPGDVGDVGDVVAQAIGRALRPLTDKEVAAHRVCELEGTIGHAGCGVCEHGLVYVECEPCFRKRIESTYR